MRRFTADRTSATYRSIADATSDAVDAAIRGDLRGHGAYEAYIASAAWRDNPARLAELEAAGNRCRLCDRGPPHVRLEVHHRTYRNLGCERVEDLTTLCSPCHRATSEILKERRSHGATTGWPPSLDRRGPLRRR